MFGASAGIKHSLMLMLLLTSSVGVLVSGAAYSGYDFFSARQLTRNSMETLAQILASNSAAALAFDNPDDASLTLSAARARAHVTAAMLYNRDGRLFAAYPGGFGADLLSERLPAAGFQFEGNGLIITRPVLQDQRRLGTLVLVSDLGAVYQRLRLDLLMGLMVLAVSLAVAYAVASRLQQTISRPILALAHTARAVSENRDYSVRAPSAQGLELTLLTGAFNHMLIRIEHDQRRLQSQLSRLDLLQRVTRAIGDRQDLPGLFDVVLRALEQDLKVDFCCACLHDPGTGVMRLVTVGAGSGAQAARLALTLGEELPIGPNGLRRCAAGELVFEPDTGALDYTLPRRFFLAGLRSLVIAPLLVVDRVGGMLLVARSARNDFSSTDCEFLLHLSQQVALAARQAQLHEALQRAYDDLRQSQQVMMQQDRLRALGQMASGIAHDINNAISPAALYTDLLLQDEAVLPAPARRQLTIIQRALEDVAATVARMREFYRPREQQTTLAPLALNRLVEDVIERTRSRWSNLSHERGVAVQLQQELAPDLPRIMGAEAEIRDALTNLVLNAVDAMPAGGVLTLRTRRVVADGGSVVCIEVADTGLGMDEETRRRCLEPFFTTKGERGTGLGLAMVYGMVQRHSAELAIDSEPGKGTTVRLSFPVWDASTSSTQPLPILVPPRALRILLVDDDPLILQSVRDILVADKHVVTIADGGHKGIEAFRAALAAGQNFDVVITDLGMPDVDGRQVAATVETLASATPVILLTGWGRRLVADDEVPPHVDRVLSKPPRISELREALATLVGTGSV